MKYSFHPYHNYFPERAQIEIAYLKKVLPQAKIEHFGSTAIPGVGGKGIIDIYISVPKETLQKASNIIKSLGYEFKLKGGIPNERLFHQKSVVYTSGRKQTFHVHLTYMGNREWEKSLAFRDFLRSNPELAEKYSEIKLKAVESAKKFRKKQDKKEAYLKAKKPVIDKILKLMK